MESEIDKAWNALSQNAVVVPLIQFVFGAATNTLKSWVPNEDSLNSRIDFLTKRIIQKISSFHTKLLQPFYAVGVPVISDTNNYESDIEEFCFLLYKANSDHHDLLDIKKKVKFLYDLFLFTIYSSIIFCILIFILTSIKAHLALISLLIILVQLFIIGFTRNINTKLTEYEKNV